MIQLLQDYSRQDLRFMKKIREIFDSLDSISRVLIDVLKRDKYPGHIIFYPKHSCCKKC